MSASIITILTNSIVPNFGSTYSEYEGYFLTTPFYFPPKTEFFGTYGLFRIPECIDFYACIIAIIREETIT